MTIYYIVTMLSDDTASSTNGMTLLTVSCHAFVLSHLGSHFIFYSIILF